MYAKLDNGKFAGFFEEKPDGEFINISEEEHASLYDEYCRIERAIFIIDKGRVVVGSGSPIKPRQCDLEERVEEANSIIEMLSDERDAGIISDDDLERWKAWVAYRKTLRAIDVTATNIEWPTKPE